MNRFEPRPRVAEAADDAFLVRHATRRELPEIAELIAAAIGTYRGLVSDRMLELYIARSTEMDERFVQGGLLVAVQYGRIAGTVTFHEDASHAGFPHDWAGFGTLAVRPQMQRRGVASLLVRRCIAAAIPLASVVGIHTGEFMAGARRLYEGMGFVRLPEHDLKASDFHGFEVGEADVTALAYRFDLDDALSG